MFIVRVPPTEPWGFYSGNFYIPAYPGLLPSGCSQLSMSVALQPPQAQPQGSSYLGKDALGLPEPSLGGTGRAQPQAGKVTGTWLQGRT